MSTPAEPLQSRLTALTQIVTQVCAEVGGRNGKRGRFIEIYLTK